MRRNPTFLIASLLALLALAGCGDKPKSGSAVSSAAAPKTAPVAPTLQELIPSNTAMMLYVKSPRALEGKVRKLVGIFDEEMTAQVDLAQLAAQLPPQLSEQLDFDKPLAVCVSLPAAGADIMEAMQQEVAVVFGVKDAAAAKAAAVEAKMPFAETSGSFLVIAMKEGVKLGGAALVETMPEGDIALRIDLAALSTRFSKEIDEGLKMAEGALDETAKEMPAQQMGMLGSIFKPYMDGLRDFAESAESFDLGLSINDTVVDLAVGFTAREGSKLDIQGHDHDGLAALAAHLPKDYPVHMLLTMDMGKLMEWAASFMEQAAEMMPEENRAAYKQLMAESVEMSKLLGPHFAGSLGLPETGMQVAYIYDTHDAQTVLQKMDELITSDAMKAFPGIEYKKLEGTKIAGIDVRSYALSMDMAAIMKAQPAGQDLPAEMMEQASGMFERIFGGKAIHMDIAAVENRLVATAGGKGHAGITALIDSLSKGTGDTPAALADAIRKAGGKPTFIFQADIRTLMQQLMPLVAEVAGQELPAVPAGGPIPAMVWGKHDGRVYGGGLSIDVGGIAELVKAMDK